MVPVHLGRHPRASLQDHPAPYPLELANRLVRMFSFAGDAVLDPFAGTGTTALAAMHAGRSSVSYEVERRYLDLIKARLAQADVLRDAIFHFEERDTNHRRGQRRTARSRSVDPPQERPPDG